jgi:tRNA A-37 threonylcarbamoyl transferase component Bud32
MEEHISAQPALTAKEALAAFLHQPIDTISCEPLTGGSEEDSLQKCTYLDTSYVVKLLNNQASGKNEIAWTQLASDLGIGPRLYYADPQACLMIIEFAKGNSLVPISANAPAILKSIATSLTRLHQSAAPFAYVSDMFTRIQDKQKKLHCSGKLQEMIATGLKRIAEIQVQLSELTVPLTPCHNDLNPGNIFVHDNQVTLIDWGDAALGNPYYDIAAFFVLNCIDSKGEQTFFEQYGPTILGSKLQTYMSLYKQLVHFEFALNLLLGVQARNSEMLHKHTIPQVNELSYYLTLLAERKADINSTFLYSMAIASLTQMVAMSYE